MSLREIMFFSWILAQVIEGGFLIVLTVEFPIPIHHGELPHMAKVDGFRSSGYFAINVRPYINAVDGLQSAGRRNAKQRESGRKKVGS